MILTFLLFYRESWHTGPVTFTPGCPNRQIWRATAGVDQTLPFN